MLVTAVMELADLTIPDVLRSQVFSLICLLLLSLFPFLGGILPFILLAFRHDLSLLEHGNRWPDALIKIFLIDFNPQGVCLF